MRIRILVRLLTAAWLAGLGAAPAFAAGDYPYYRLNYADYDTTYEAVEAQARHYAFFYWDGRPYCRYRTAWNGPGAYIVGTRDKPGFGWDGGYPWQGPGTPADHEDDEDYALAQANYAREFGHQPVCEPRRHYRHRAVVLRRRG